MNQHTHSQQKGFSLVELMIALVVGLMLTAGVIRIFIANKQTYRVADANARIQENARFAIEILGRHLRLTGYRDTNNVSTDFSSTFPAVSFSGYNFAAGEVIRGTDNEVIVRYQGDGNITDCEDNSLITAGNEVVSRLFLNAGSLRCATNVDAAGDQPLISDVSSMLVRYGIDTDGDGTADRYDRTAGVTDWRQVVSIRVTLTLQAADLNTSVTGGNLQKTYTTTIGLRNLLP